MKLCRCLRVLMMVTLMSLIYIHLQVQIYDLAYQGKNKQKKIRNLLDDKGDTVYDICMLKSANHLGVTLLTDGSDMQFLDKDQIVEVKVRDRAGDARLASAVSPKKEPNIFAKLFSLKAQAEARTIK
ncbi:MAG: hypothetical protein ABIJ41_03460 [Candidatus Omnitrophota bacterium]